MFELFDRDKKGLISAEELKELNVDGVKMLNFDEFARLMDLILKT